MRKATIRDLENFGTIHIHKVLRYLHDCIESGGDLSRPATEPQGHGASLEKERDTAAGQNPT
jgi:hypothetical protein